MTTVTRLQRACQGAATDRADVPSVPQLFLAGAKLDAPDFGGAVVAIDTQALNQNSFRCSIAGRRLP